MGVLLQKLVLFFILFTAIGLSQCSSSGDGAADNGGGEETNTTSFPSSLAIASPTSNIASDCGDDCGDNLMKILSSYEVETSEIEDILTATSLANCVDDFFADLTTAPGNAECYGPTVDYANHPDDTGGSDPLPGGDVGMWIETEASTGEACAAAQLNARMEAVADKATIALKTLASMVCTINNTSGLALPSAGSSVTLTSEMNDMLDASSLSPIPTVNLATLAAASNDVGTTDYTYSINVTYTLIDPEDPASTIDIVLQTDMTHRPLDSTNSTYRGQFSYYFSSEDNLGNCNRDFGVLNTSTITELGSVTYELALASSLMVDARYTQACGDENTDPLVDGVLDPSVKAATQSMPGGPDINGWAQNFSVMAADFNPTNNEGDFVFAWQAGVGDGTARTFNVHTEDTDSDSNLNGIAFFGFGDDIEDSDGSIEGIYCNWAGPSGGVGNQIAKRQDLVQRQEMEEDAGTEIFEEVSSNITYAPTLSCDYDGTGTFTYDSDGNGTTDTNAATAINNNLVDPAGATNGISASGFTLPTAPTSL